MEALRDVKHVPLPLRAWRTAPLSSPPSATTPLIPYTPLRPSGQRAKSSPDTPASHKAVPRAALPPSFFFPFLEKTMRSLLALACLAGAALVSAEPIPGGFTQGSSLAFYQNLTDTEVSEREAGREEEALAVWRATPHSFPAPRPLARATTARMRSSPPYALLEGHGRVVVKWLACQRADRPASAARKRGGRRERASGCFLPLPFASRPRPRSRPGPTRPPSFWRFMDPVITLGAPEVLPGALKPRYAPLFLTRPSFFTALLQPPSPHSSFRPASRPPRLSLSLSFTQLANIFTTYGTAVMPSQEPQYDNLDGQPWYDFCVGRVS